MRIIIQIIVHFDIIWGFILNTRFNLYQKYYKFYGIMTNGIQK
jgi:hypothetical protein